MQSRDRQNTELCDKVQDDVLVRTPGDGLFEGRQCFVYHHELTETLCSLLTPGSSCITACFDIMTLHVHRKLKKRNCWQVVNLPKRSQLGNNWCFLLHLKEKMQRNKDSKKDEDGVKASWSRYDAGFTALSSV